MQVCSVKQYTPVLDPAPVRLGEPTPDAPLVGVCGPAGLHQLLEVVRGADGEPGPHPLDRHLVA